jgi:hypothetical protein
MRSPGLALLKSKKAALEASQKKLFSKKEQLMTAAASKVQIVDGLFQVLSTCGMCLNVPCVACCVSATRHAVLRCALCRDACCRVHDYGLLILV